ncbi:hypothetical protein ETECTG_CDS0184 [Escherichia phage ETEC-TG]|nr:hypothetical protein ETECTG_CDS0184 [Escherichia phage ETEC-TG]
MHKVCSKDSVLSIVLITQKKSYLKLDRSRVGWGKRRSGSPIDSNEE